VSPRSPLPFGTTPDQLLELPALVSELRAAALDESFIVAAEELARIDQGVFDLVALWREITDAAERDEIIADVWDSICDHEDAPAKPLHKPFIRFEALDNVAKSVLEHKQRLRALIAGNSGVVAVAAKSGIPLPALSRMLGTAALPRWSMVYRIAVAMGVSEAEVVGEWGR
jgi:hypothetical protein